MIVKFSLVFPVMNQLDTFMECLNSFYANAKYPEDISLIIIDNGSEPSVEKSLVPFMIKYPLVKTIIHRNAENVGVTKSLNQAWQLSKEGCCNPDFLFYSHSDVLIQEKDWDVKVRNWLEKISNIGVMGFGGAKGIGREDIYKTPYEIWQLARFGFFSNMQDAEIHGRRMTNEIEPCVVLDGFSLIVNTKLLDEINGFDEINYPTHHCYDLDVCLESIKHGYYNFVLNVASHHLGGVTATRSDYDTWLRNQDINGDSEVHAKAHVNFYNKWYGMLPLYWSGNTLYIIGNRKENNGSDD